MKLDVELFSAQNNYEAVIYTAGKKCVGVEKHVDHWQVICTATWLRTKHKCGEIEYHFNDGDYSMFGACGLNRKQIVSRDYLPGCCSLVDPR